MSAFTLRLEIARSVESVFSYLADVEATPKWYAAVTEATRLSPGPLLKGSTYAITRRLPQGLVENEVAVVELTPPERLTIQSRSGPTPFTYRYSLSSLGTGTLLTLEGDISTAGLGGLAALLSPLAGVLFKRGMADNLNTFKSQLEGRTAR